MRAITGHGGVPIAVARRGGTRPPVVAVHATGFCKETLFPVLASPPLEGRAFLTIDQRGHGDSGSPDPPYDWWDMARDVVAAVEATDLEPGVGLGHSSGAALCLMAELLRPGTFVAMVLVEPIVLPPPHARKEDDPLAAIARRRRSRFGSRDEALTAFLGRGPFAGWSAAALDAYVDHGFRRGSAGVELKCRPEVEADLYASGHQHDAWENLADVRCPVLVVAGAESPTQFRDLAARQVARLSAGSLVVVPDLGHFAPMQDPDLIAGMVAAAGPAGFGLR